MIFQTLRVIRSLNPSLRTLFFVTLVFRAGTMAFPFFAVYLLARNAYTVGQIGAVVAMFGAGALVADLLAGVLLGLFASRTMMLGGLLLTCGALAALPFLTSIPALVAATFVWGFGYEVFTPASYSETIAHSTEADRKVAFSCNRLAINLGMGVGPAVGALVFTWQPGWLFAINSAMTALAIGYLLVSLRGGEASRGKERAPRRKFRLVAETARGEARFWTIFGLTIPIHLAYALPPTLLSAYLIHELHMASAWAGAVFSLNAVCIVLFEVPLNNAMRNMSHFRSLMAGFALACGGFALIAWAASPVVLLLSTLIWTAGEMIVFPSLLHYVSEVSDPSITGRNLGLYSAGVNLGLILTPQISLALTAAYGPSTPWYAAGGALLAALLVLITIRHNGYVWLPEAQHGEVASAPAVPAQPEGDEVIP